MAGAVGWVEKERRCCTHTRNQRACSTLSTVHIQRALLRARLCLKFDLPSAAGAAMLFRSSLLVFVFGREPTKPRGGEKKLGKTILAAPRSNPFHENPRFDVSQPRRYKVRKLPPSPQPRLKCLPACNCHLCVQPFVGASHPFLFLITGITNILNRSSPQRTRPSRVVRNRSEVVVVVGKGRLSGLVHLILVLLEEGLVHLHLRRSQGRSGDEFLICVVSPGLD